MRPKLSIAALRRHVIAAQGYASRYRRASDEELLACIGRLSCVQLDSIATVERSHLLVLGARIGQPKPDAVSRLLGAGRIFEYWAHEASLIPIEDYPLFRRRMREREHHHWWGPVIASDPRLAASILARIREEGPLGSRHFEGKGGGGMWLLKPAKRMLDALWTAGQLCVGARQGFQRLYDLPERILPPKLLDAPIPNEAEVLRSLLVRAVVARGALTASGIANHYRFKGGIKQLSAPLGALVREGALVQRELDDGGAPVYLPAGSEPERAPAPRAAVLLSPFENLLWDRDFTQRLFGFEHLIEVYKPQPQRRFGYYVMPLLYGERLVGRADLKSDRDAGVLRLRALHLEAGVRRSAALSSAFEAALERLARTLGLAGVAT